MLRAILFDLGDTLIDFEPMDTRALFRHAAADTYAFLKARGAALAPFPRYCKSQFAAIRWAYFWAKLRGREFNSLRLLEQFCDRARIPLTPAELDELAWRWYAPLVRHSSIEPGLPATLAALRAAGIQLGIVSNTFVPSVVLDRHLALHGLLDDFPLRIYSSEVGYRKPDRRIFDLALNALGVMATDTMFVGDLLKTDIIGARRAGLQTVLKRPWGGLRGHRVADHVVGQISELLPILDLSARTSPARVVSEPIEPLHLPFGDEPALALG